MLSLSRRVFFKTLDSINPAFIVISFGLGPLLCVGSPRLNYIKIYMFERVKTINTSNINIDFAKIRYKI